MRARTLAALVVVAALVRLPGFLWGLPGPTHLFSFHPDEFHSLRGVLSLSQGDLNPHFFNYGCLYLDLVDAVCAIAHPSTVFGLTVSGLPAALRTWTADARAVSLVAGLATVVVVALAAEAMLAGAGLWAGLALALMPLHALNCRYATVDVTLGLWVGLALLLALLAKVRGRPGLYVAAGFAAGLAASTKYSGAVALLIPVVAVAVDEALAPRRRALLAGLAALAALAAFALTSPYVFLAWQEAHAAIAYETHHMRAGESPAREADPSGLWFHLKWLTLGTAGLGTAGLLAVLFGLRGERRRLWAGPAAFAAVGFAMIAVAGVRYARYEVYLLPVAAVGVGVLLRGLTARRLGWLAGLWLALAAAHCTLIAVRLAGPDSHLAALAAIEARTAPSARVGMIWQPWFQSPPLDYCNGGAMLRGNPLWARFSRLVRPLAVIGYSAARLDRDRPQWFVVSAVERRDYLRTGTEMDLWRDLHEHYRVVASWDAGRWSGLVPRFLNPPQDWLYPAMPLWLLERKAPAGKAG